MRPAREQNENVLLRLMVKEDLHLRVWECKEHIGKIRLHRVNAMEIINKEQKHTNNISLKN